MVKEYWMGKYHCTIELLFDCFWISCMLTGSFCFYFQNRLIQTGQTEGQWYSDTSPFSIPCFGYAPHRALQYYTVVEVTDSDKDSSSVQL
jgi:hypothetical protein